MNVRALLALAGVAFAPPSLAGDDRAPVNKPDGSSLSGAQKENIPATKDTGENQPVGGSAVSGASEGTSGSTTSVSSMESGSGGPANKTDSGSLSSGQNNPPQPEGACSKRAAPSKIGLDPGRLRLARLNYPQHRRGMPSRHSSTADADFSSCIGNTCFSFTRTCRISRSRSRLRWSCTL